MVRLLGVVSFCRRGAGVLLVSSVAAIVLLTALVNQNPTASNTIPEGLEIQYTPMPNLPPIAVVTPSQSEIQVGERLILSGKGSIDPDGEIVSHHWSFVKGSSIEAPEITVQFLAAGTRTVLLIVTDDHGMQATARASIDVVEPPPRQTLLLSAGPINVFEIAPGTDAVIELRVAVFGQRATGLELAVVDDGGLDVVPSKVPGSLGPSETVTVQLRVRVPTNIRAPVGATVQVVVRSDQSSSSVERLEVMIPSSSSTFEMPWELLETVALMAFATAVCIVIERRRRR